MSETREHMAARLERLASDAERSLQARQPIEDDRAELADLAALRAGAAALRAELTENMLRYAMACIGTGSPADANMLRLFWRFAHEAVRLTPPEAD